MKYMHDLKDMLCAELEEYAQKQKMSAGDLETVHKLTDTVKNIMKINVLEEEMDDGASGDSRWMGEGRMYGSSYADGMSYGGGSSYARGRGRYAKRDSMGRYSRTGGSYDDMSYARGGNQGGGNRSSYRGGSSRDSYSRDGAKEYMMEQLEEMMEQAEKPAEREALKRCMTALERA